MSKTDPYPQNFEIEIDRAKLAAYKRRTGFLASSCVFGFLGLMLSGAALSTIHEVSIGWAIALLVPVGGAGCGMALGGLIYLLFGHRSAKRDAEGLSVFVEGASLRIVQKRKLTHQDTRIPLRSINQFSCIQDGIMHWCEIKGLWLTMNPRSIKGYIKIPAVKNCEVVRDMLCEIDQLRNIEQQK